jgi:hypothetical protein
MRAKLRHTGMTNAIALDHSIGIIQTETDPVSPSRQILCRYLGREIQEIHL